MNATYVDVNEFTVVGDRTAEFITGRRIKADCGVDGIKYCTVSSSAFGATTAVITKESELTANLTTVLYGIVEPATSGSLPDHTHDGTEGSGGGTAAGSAMMVAVNAAAQMALLSGNAAAAFSLNSQDLTDVGDIGCANVNLLDSDSVYFQVQTTGDNTKDVGVRFIVGTNKYYYMQHNAGDETFELKYYNGADYLSRMTLESDGTFGFGIAPTPTVLLYSVASTIKYGAYFQSNKSDGDATGVIGRATTNNTGTNVGVYGYAANAGAGNPYHFYSQDGDSCIGGAWNDSSHSSYKKLIRDLKDKDFEKLYKLLDNLNMKSYRHNAEIPILGYNEENLITDELGDEELEPIYDDPFKAPKRFGLMADDVDLPEFLATKDRKGLAGGRLANYSLICHIHVKSLIEDLTRRVKVLEEI